MSEMTDSRLAAFEAIIALAWADHELDPGEKAALHNLIEKNLYFSDEQRAALYRKVDQPCDLKSIWPRITEPVDRAHVIDLANHIFNKDGEYCETEKELYEWFYGNHMGSIDSEAIEREIASMAKVQQHQNAMQQEQIANMMREKGVLSRLSYALSSIL